MPVEIDKDGNYTFDGQVNIPGGKAGEDYTFTIRQPDLTPWNSEWEPIGFVSGRNILEVEERVDKLEKLIRVLADALGVNEEFLSCVAEGI